MLIRRNEKSKDESFLLNACTIELIVDRLINASINSNSILNNRKKEAGLKHLLSSNVQDY